MFELFQIRIGSKQVSAATTEGVCVQTAHYGTLPWAHHKILTNSYF